MIFCIYCFSCSKKENEILIPQGLYDQIELTDFRHDYYFNHISCEFFNKTNYTITRFVYRFELYQYDPDCKLKILYDKVIHKFAIGEFNEFAKKMRSKENRKYFYDLVSKEINIGSFSNVNSAAIQFEESKKILILARKLAIEMTLEPNLSINFKQEIPHSFLIEHPLYSFQLQEAYGYQ